MRKFVFAYLAITILSSGGAHKHPDNRRCT